MTAKISLVKIEKNKLSDFLSEKEIHSLGSKNEPVFKITGNFVTPKENELVNVEISLRKCERVGVFNN